MNTAYVEMFPFSGDGFMDHREFFHFLSRFRTEGHELVIDGSFEGAGYHGLQEPCFRRGSQYAMERTVGKPLGDLTPERLYPRRGVEEVQQGSPRSYVEYTGNVRCSGALSGNKNDKRRALPSGFVRLPRFEKSGSQSDTTVFT
jgi:hypothetical protein